jgi:hypothetical protein
LYAHGTTGSIVEVVELEDGEVALKSDLVFNTTDGYNYYLEGNKMVSPGYTASYLWVDNPEEVGYDIEMVGVDEVNHLAITRLGRGGSQVSIIDSLIGGIRMLKFKSGILGFLNRKSMTQDSVKVPFSKSVFDAVEKAQRVNESGAKELQASITDSLASLRDTETRTVLCDSVADIFTDIPFALTQKEKLSPIIDSLFAQAERETLSIFDSAMENADAEKKDSEKESSDVADTATEDEDAKVKDSDKESSDVVDTATEDEDGKGKGTANISDSVLASVGAEIDKRFEDFEKRIFKNLGIKPDRQTVSGGSITDSAITGLTVNVSDYVD